MHESVDECKEKRRRTSAESTAVEQRKLLDTLGEKETVNFEVVILRVKIVSVASVHVNRVVRRKGDEIRSETAPKRGGKGAIVPLQGC